MQHHSELTQWGATLVIKLRERGGIRAAPAPPGPFADGTLQMAHHRWCANMKDAANGEGKKRILSESPREVEGRKQRREGKKRERERRG